MKFSPSGDSLFKYNNDGAGTKEFRLSIWDAIWSDTRSSTCDQWEICVRSAEMAKSMVEPCTVVGNGLVDDGRVGVNQLVHESCTSWCCMVSRDSVVGNKNPPVLSVRSGVQ